MHISYYLYVPIHRVARTPESREREGVDVNHYIFFIIII